MIRNNNGFSLLEVLLASSILIAGILVILQVQDFMNAKVELTSKDLQVNDMIFELSQDIRNNIGKYQTGIALEYANDEGYTNNMVLPMAWDAGKTIASNQNHAFIEVATCGTGCPRGRLGYRIVPFIGYSGFYTVYIVYENSAIFVGRRLAKFFVKGN
jgi:Tfp pilus assembly protein PilV